MVSTTLKNTRHGSLPGNGSGGSIVTIKHPSPGSFIMGSKIEYQVGNIIGNCIYLGEVKLSRSNRIAKFLCVCGNEFVACLYNVNSGNTKSCGCIQKKAASISSTRHGLSRHKLYAVWSNIKTRCYDINYKGYRWYGQCGVTVYETWRYDFKAFYDYVMSLPNAMESGLTIDRINPFGNYEPGNLRWVDRLTQANNTRKKYNHGCNR